MGLCRNLADGCKIKLWPKRWTELFLLYNILVYILINEVSLSHKTKQCFQFEDWATWPTLACEISMDQDCCVEQLNASQKLLSLVCWNWTITHVNFTQVITFVRISLNSSQFCSTLLSREVYAVSCTFLRVRISVSSILFFHHVR